MWSLAVLRLVNRLSLRKDNQVTGEGKAGLKEKLRQEVESALPGISKSISWAPLGQAAPNQRTAVKAFRMWRRDTSKQEILGSLH